MEQSQIAKYLLRQNNVAITVDDMEYSIYSDDKWVRLILDQIISNVIKYRTGHPILHLLAVKEMKGLFFLLRITV